MSSSGPLGMNFEDEWPQLKAGIEKIMHLESLPRKTWQITILKIYNLCLNYENPFSESIYEKTRDFLTDLVVSCHREINSGVDMLVTYEKRWKEYREGLSRLSVLLRPVNEIYVRRKQVDCGPFGEHNMSNHALFISQLGLHLWKDNVLQKEVIKKLSWHLPQELRNDRPGKCSNLGALQTVIKSLFEVVESAEDATEVYREILEDRFLSDSGEYYRIRADEEIRNGDCSRYMRKALQWMNDEMARSSKFLHPSTVPKVQIECIQRTVVERMEYLHTEFKKMIPREEKHDYQNLYALLKQTENGLDVVASDMEAYIKDMGCTAMTAVADDSPETFVETFLEVREKYLKLIKECFHSDSKFTAALDQACVSMLKCDGHELFADRSAELLAAYCDRILKKNQKEEDVEAHLSRAIVVFSYIQDKDLFQRLYSQMLCKRLLHGRPDAMHLEEIMIAKLIRTCGHEFTRKFNDMYTEANLKKSLNDEFQEVIADKGVDLGLSFEAAVLRTSSWPCSGNTFSFAIPQILEKSVTEFETFYRRKHSGRKLTWLHHMSTAELKLCYLPKKYVISMTTHQMAVLLLFEKTDKLSTVEIKEYSRLDSERLDKVIHSLTEAKLLLTDDSSSEDNGIYELNLKFSSKRSKFKIPPFARKDKKEVTREEVTRVRYTAEVVRRFILEAAIVRVMKARRTLKHNDLIQEVIQQVSQRFVPKIPLFQKCIDALIGRDYLQRNPDCPNEYMYIA